MQRLPFITLETQTDTTFVGHLPDDTRFSLRLVRAHDLGQRPADGGPLPCYWLLFEALDHTDHRAGPHVLRHPTLGEFRCDLVLVGHAGGRTLLQALFD